MVKVFSFSLFGTDQKYFNGALAMADQAAQMFPSYECWFYVHKAVPESFISMLSKQYNVRVIIKDEDLNTSRPLMWRFEAIDHPDCEVMMPRDTDTRFYLREKFAIQEWLESNKTLHIMRDSPFHTDLMMAGMFGVRKFNFCWTDAIKIWPQSGYNYDQIFLKTVIYPLLNNSIFVHDSFNNYESCKHEFPINYDPDFHFVGEYVFEDGSRDKRSIEITKAAWLSKGGQVGFTGLF
jgi:hypothetical protein